MSTGTTLAPCGECGMPCALGEYHPYAACLMFKACNDGDTVRSNLAAVRASGAREADATVWLIDTGGLSGPEVTTLKERADLARHLGYAVTGLIKP